MSNGIGANPLNAISKVYLDQIAEKKDDTYLEPDMKKRQKNNEKARKDMEKMGTSMKNPHFEEKQQGWDAVNSLAGAYEAMQQDIVDEKFSMAADPSKPEAPRPTRKAANKKSMSMKSRAVKAIGTQRRQDIETGITKESLEATGLFSEAEISRILDIVED